MRSLLASLLNKRLVPSHQALSSKERLGGSARRTPSGDILGFGATEHPPPTHTHNSCPCESSERSRRSYLHSGQIWPTGLSVSTSSKDLFVFLS